VTGAVAPASTAKPLQVAVIGAGAFGKNHVRVYGELARDGLAQLAAIVDVSESAAPRELALQHGAAFYAKFEAFLADVDSGKLAVNAASVCVPTSHHAEIAAALMSSGIDVLVEKPMAADLAQADAMLQAAAAKERVLQVGHLERFNPAVSAVLPHLTRPMFFECHRLSIFTPRSLDVDVVLDLMIHDLDIVLQMAGSKLREVRAVGLPVLSRHVDIANVRLEFESGCVANFTASRVSTERVRKLRLFQPGEYISLDYARQDAFRIQVKAEESPANALAGLQFEKLEVIAGDGSVSPRGAVARAACSHGPAVARGACAGVGDSRSDGRARTQGGAGLRGCASV
jgi:predicted dehydrogenase